MFSSLSHLTVNKILNLELIFFFCSEDIKNQNKIFPWNCENQEKFIGKGRGNSRILFKHYFPFNSAYRTMPFSFIVRRYM